MDHPLVYRLRVARMRLRRHLSDWFAPVRFAGRRSVEPLPFTCKKHQSLLRRKLGSTEPQWQENKIVNLTIAAKTADGVLIEPGETFSFWRLVGNTTAAKGYLEGMELWEDRVVAGVGGGICQLANLLYWMALHTPLRVVEHHHHSFDPFPDDRRTLPFGSGASVFYNYIDLRFYNPTDQTFQIRVWLTEQHLKGAITTDQAPAVSYHIEERNHRFVREGGKNYRGNELWRHVVDVRTGQVERLEMLIANFAEVRYELFGAPTGADVAVLGDVAADPPSGDPLKPA